jgi:hypothetical protein
MLVSEQVRHAAEMRRCLVECDVAAARLLWHQLAPHAPAPKTDYDALCCIHYARTITATIGLRLRSYSHHWLIDHGLPSGLPDELRQKADRLYPHIVDAVGLAAKSSFPEVANAVQTAMEGGVHDCYADNRREGLFVRSVVLERRAQAKKALHGILSEKATQDLLQRTLQSLRKKGDD